MKSQTVKEKKEPFILKPVNRYLVVKEIVLDVKLPSGVILPSASKTNTSAYLVVAIADDCTIPVTEGSIIAINGSAGFPFTSEGVQYRNIAQLDVIALYDTTRVAELQKEKA